MTGCKDSDLVGADHGEHVAVPVAGRVRLCAVPLHRLSIILIDPVSRSGGALFVRSVQGVADLGQQVGEVIVQAACRLPISEQAVPSETFETSNVPRVSPRRHLGELCILVDIDGPIWQPKGRFDLGKCVGDWSNIASTMLVSTGLWSGLNVLFMVPSILVWDDVVFLDSLSPLSPPWVAQVWIGSVSRSTDLDGIETRVGSMIVNR